MSCRKRSNVTRPRLEMSPGGQGTTAARRARVHPSRPRGIGPAVSTRGHGGLPWAGLLPERHLSGGADSPARSESVVHHDKRAPEPVLLTVRFGARRASFDGRRARWGALVSYRSAGPSLAAGVPFGGRKLPLGPGNDRLPAVPDSILAASRRCTSRAGASARYVTFGRETRRTGRLSTTSGP